MLPQNDPCLLGVPVTLEELQQALACRRAMIQGAPIGTLLDQPPRRYLPWGWTAPCIYAERAPDSSLRLIYAILDARGQEHYRRAVRLFKRQPLRLV